MTYRIWLDEQRWAGFVPYYNLQFSVGVWLHRIRKFRSETSFNQCPYSRHPSSICRCVEVSLHVPSRSITS